MFQRSARLSRYLEAVSNMQTSLISNHVYLMRMYPFAYWTKWRYEAVYLSFAKPKYSLELVFNYMSRKLRQICCICCWQQKLTVISFRNKRCVPVVTNTFLNLKYKAAFWKEPQLAPSRTYAANCCHVNHCSASALHAMQLKTRVTAVFAPSSIVCYQMRCALTDWFIPGLWSRYSNFRLRFQLRTSKNFWLWLRLQDHLVQKIRKKRVLCLQLACLTNCVCGTKTQIVQVLGPPFKFFWLQPSKIACALAPQPCFVLNFAFLLLPNSLYLVLVNLAYGIFINCERKFCYVFLLDIVLQTFFSSPVCYFHACDRFMLSIKLSVFENCVWWTQTVKGRPLCSVPMLVAASLRTTLN